MTINCTGKKSRVKHNGNPEYTATIGNDHLCVKIKAAGGRGLCPRDNEMLFFTSLNIFLWYDFTPDRKDVSFIDADTDYPLPAVLRKGCH
jgi:hypothetical protein